MLSVATFSVIAVDASTGDLGVGTASRYIAVGSLVPHVRAGVAAVATQSVAHPALAGALLEDLSSRRRGPQESLDTHLADDAERQLRQIAVVTAEGKSATFTGSQCVQYAGVRGGNGVVCIGNTLTGPSVLDAMLAAFHHTKGQLWTRLIVALRAGEAEGGDKRGKQAAALRVHREGGGYRGSGDVLVDLRVDDDEEPVLALEQLLERLRETWDSEPGKGLSK
jgi:uncharacterized Ntn-hydrolase superfamily protein